MGQKVNPNIMRKGIVTGEFFNWYADGNKYRTYLHEDLNIRNYLNKTYKVAGVSKVEIDRSNKKITVNVHTARPGIVIGRKGVDLDSLKKKLATITIAELTINVIEVKKPELSSVLVASNVARQLEKRISFRKATKRAIQSAMRMGAKGVKIAVSGRLGGAEIARSEWYREGRVPLHTFRSQIEFAREEAHTTYGVIGVKVWIYMGDKLEKSTENNFETRFKNNEAA